MKYKGAWRSLRYKLLEAGIICPVLMHFRTAAVQCQRKGQTSRSHSIYQHPPTLSMTFMCFAVLHSDAAVLFHCNTSVFIAIAIWWRWAMTLYLLWFIVLSHTLFLQDHGEKLAEVKRAQRMCQVPGNQGVSLPTWKIAQCHQSLQQIQDRFMLS